MPTKATLAIVLTSTLAVAACGVSTPPASVASKNITTARSASAPPTGAPVAMLAAVGGGASGEILDGSLAGEDIPVAYDRASVDRDLRRGSMVARKRCGMMAPAANAQGTVVLLRKVTLTLGRDGRVTTMRVVEYGDDGAGEDDSALGKCVRASFDAAHVTPYAAASDASIDWLVGIHR